MAVKKEFIGLGALALVGGGVFFAFCQKPSVSANPEVKLTNMVGTDLPVVLREVLDEKGRRLVISSSHEVEGAKVDAINGILVTCIGDVDRALKEVPATERSILLLGEVKKEVEPIEPESEADSKKASPLFQAPDDAAAAAERLRALAESTDGPELSLTTPGDDAESASPEPVKLSMESPKAVSPPKEESLPQDRDTDPSPARSSNTSTGKAHGKPHRRIVKKIVKK